MNTWNLAAAADAVIGIAENAVAISALISDVGIALRNADPLDPIWEVSEKCPLAGRSVVQIRVSATLFESFFNSSKGYRAMFRRGPRIGSVANAALVASVKDRLSKTLPDSVTAHLIEFGPTWIGRTTVSKLEFLRSFDPALAKIWYSTAEVAPSGEIRLMPTGTSEGKIDVGLPHACAEIRQDPEDCILEAKGAFIGPHGLFQSKDPEFRAQTLFIKGEA